MTFVQRVLGGAALALLMSLAPPAWGALIGSGSGTQDTIAPAGIPGWLNVGRIGTGSGVYLGNGWVLTAWHVDPMSSPAITFFPTDQFPSGGVTYALDPSSVVQIHNLDNLTATDLVLMRTTTDPGLPALKIATATPDLGSAITLTGFGVNRGDAVQYDVNWNEVSSGGLYSGYKLNPNGVYYPTGYAKRWGTSYTSAYPGGFQTERLHVNGLDTELFTAAFQQPSSASDETAIGVSGDSGGAVFSSDNTLLGVMLYQDYLNVPVGQPYDVNSSVGTVIYGNGADTANIAAYAAQIQAIIAPEPGSAMLLAGGFGLMFLRRREG